MSTFTAVASVPGAILLAYMPHLVKAVTSYSKLGSKNYAKNNLNPRDPVVPLDDKDGKNKETVSFVSRCTSAHLNGLEAFPQWAFAVAFAHLFKVDADFLNSTAVKWLAARFVYNLVYLFGTRPKFGLLRSLVWFYSVGLILTVFLKVLATFP